MGLFGGKKNDPVAIAQQQRQREQQEIEQEFLRGITTLRDDVAQTVVAAVATAAFQTHGTRFEIDFVVRDEDVFRLQPVEFHQTSQRLSAAVHERRRFQQPDTVTANVNFRDLAVKAFFRGKHHAMLPHQCVNKPKPGIVPGFGIFRAGIAEARNQLYVNRQRRHRSTV